MSNFMLLGILRMPIEADDGVVAFTQFRSAARSAADRIEQLTAERDGYRQALRHIVTYLAEPTDLEGDTMNALRGDMRFVQRAATSALNHGDQAVSGAARAALKGETP